MLRIGLCALVIKRYPAAGYDDTNQRYDSDNCQNEVAFVHMLSVARYKRRLFCAMMTETELLDMEGNR